MSQPARSAHDSAQLDEDDRHEHMRLGLYGKRPEGGIVGVEAFFAHVMEKRHMEQDVALIPGRDDMSGGGNERRETGIVGQENTEQPRPHILTQPRPSGPQTCQNRSGSKTRSA
jgi:hypothetical protein